MFDKLRQLLSGHHTKIKNQRSVLIVEDSDVDLKLIKRAVKRCGYRVLVGRNGKEGLNLARDEKPDLILLDCDMPEMTGIEMCQQLRKDTGINQTPVIFLTSDDTPANTINCFELDAENYLNKPINPRLLSSHIDMVLNEKS